MTKIKICGLRRYEDIEMVNRLRPDYCGFIINFPKSRRSLSPEKVMELSRDLDRKSTVPVGVVVDIPASLAASYLNDGIVDMIQLHGSESEDYIRQLKKLTEKPVIKAFRITCREDIEAAEKSCADYILLDQGQGGGETFDWSYLAGGCPVGRKWFLAGGLNEHNIAEAAARFRPYAVDLSSAVETDGFKDFEKVKKVIDLVRSV